MSARRLSNGNILARVAYSGSASDMVGDGLVELAPEDPGYDRWDEWLRAWEDDGESDPAGDSLPTESNWRAASAEVRDGPGPGGAGPAA